MSDAAGTYEAVDTSEVRHLGALSVEPCTLGGAPAAGRVLRRLEDGTIRSAVLELPAGWHRAVGAGPAGTTQLYVLEGRLSVDARVLAGGGFAVLRGGATWPAIDAEAATRVVAIFDAPASADGGEEAALIVEDVMTLAPFTPVIAGRLLEGFERRVLWEDAATGADTRLLRVPAGFRGGGPNWHPVNEEIFCIAGDIAPDEKRPMRAGSFLWNPARSVHGFAEHTQGGCVLLEWHDGKWALYPEPEVVRG
jgi:hypothetical protein